ncbi:hypothetical protein [Bradyrhizobium elkanii]|uniref:hypothetical protein n=1 Tax=Bradyrhizobium elkanii TaxID=29448 RepID=UPI000841D4D9|nr:hypothetical protein [Bradyrhizobium elkanii]ODM76725.1 hypothetical protein A6X20_29165 [Bradyrhizobium elkanii]ODM80804.1 hypothetical protein A6452_23710 [Bradyrhizobium elkanii]
MTKIDPARHLVLTPGQHALLGELVEIVNQIENMMIESLATLDPAASTELKGLPGLGPQAKRWAKALSWRVAGQALAAQILSVRSELTQFAEDRNDFIHALYSGVYSIGYVQGYRATSATRHRTGNNRSTAELEAIRNRAATLSWSVDAIIEAV